MLNKEISIDKLFNVMLFCKWVFAVCETVVGVAFMFISHSFITKAIFDFLEAWLSKSSDDFIANLLLQIINQPVASGKWFIVAYLLSHGLIKIGLLYGLSKRKLIAYPLSIVAFSIFLVYQLYQYYASPSFWLLALSVLEVGFILLVWYEYRIMRRHKMFSQIGNV